MIGSIRRLSRAEATARAEQIALEYATAAGIEGKLFGVEPDGYDSEHRGKTPVYWVAVFESVIGGAVFDSPLVVRINLESGNALPAV